jgi:integrase
MKTKVYSSVLRKSLRIPASVRAAAESSPEDVSHAVVTSWLASVEMAAAREMKDLSLGARVRMADNERLSRASLTGTRARIGLRTRQKIVEPRTLSKRSSNIESGATSHNSRVTMNPTAANESIITSYVDYVFSIGLSPRTAESHAAVLRKHVLPCVTTGGRLVSSSLVKTPPMTEWGRILSRSLAAHMTSRGASIGDMRKAFAVSKRLIDFLTSTGAVSSSSVFTPPPTHKPRVSPKNESFREDVKILGPEYVSTIENNIEDLTWVLKEAKIDQDGSISFATQEILETLIVWTSVGLMAAYALRPGEALAADISNILDDGKYFDVKSQMTEEGLTVPKNGSKGRVTMVTGRESLVKKIKSALSLISGEKITPKRFIHLWGKEKKTTIFANFVPKDFRREAAMTTFLHAITSGLGHGESLQLTAALLRHRNIVTTSVYLRI